MSCPPIGYFCLAALVWTLAPAIPAASAQEMTRKAEFETIVKYYSCGHSQRQNYVITDREQWEQVWQLAMSNMYPIPPAPEIDFNRQTIIAVFEGDEPSSGYSISVSKLARSGKKLKVTVKEVIPADACKVLLVVTQPVHIIVTERVPDRDRVAFKLKQQVKQCE